MPRTYPHGPSECSQVFKQLYYQNPTFGFFFLQLTSRRLFDNIKRLESEVAQLRSQLAASAG